MHILQMSGHITSTERFYITTRSALYAYAKMASRDKGPHLTCVRCLVVTFFIGTLWYIKCARVPGNFCLALTFRTWLEDIILSICHATGIEDDPKVTLDIQCLQ